jgi:excisionase family DNA binding protein
MLLPFKQEHAMTRTASPPARLLTVPEVSDRLGISARKLWRMIGTGQLKSVRVGARGTRIPEAALNEFVDALPAAR